MVDRLPYSNNNEIVAIPVPEEMHEQYKKKFELHAKYAQCFQTIKNHVLNHIEYAGEDPISIKIPMSIHPLLKARINSRWDLDSRMEVFESLRAYIVNECIKPELLLVILIAEALPEEIRVLFPIDMTQFLTLIFPMSSAVTALPAICCEYVIVYPAQFISTSLEFTSKHVLFEFTFPVNVYVPLVVIFWQALTLGSTT